MLNITDTSELFVLCNTFGCLLVTPIFTVFASTNLGLLLILNALSKFKFGQKTAYATQNLQGHSTQSLSDFT